jgi:2-polyprenyl-6-methoxyphenol hydroxylase-like FAD-dependent oxidoreductase
MIRSEVIVIGGGPAGAATALALARNGSAVLVLERSQYEHWRVGETLPPFARVLLDQLGVWDRFLAGDPTPSHAIYSAWGSDDLLAHDFIFNPHGSGWHINRKSFDAMLARAAEDVGATVLRGAKIISLSRRIDCWRIVFRREGKTLEAETPFLVDATGRAGWLARSQGSNWLSYDQLIGLTGILTPVSLMPTVASVLLLEVGEHGWWYSAPLPDGSFVVSYMTDADYLTASRLAPTIFWRENLERTTHTRARVQEFRLAGAVRVRKASTGRLDRVAGPGWVAIGDAASVYDPLSGTGLSKAIQSGLTVAQSLSGHAALNCTVLDDYAAGFVKEFANYLEQWAKYYSMEKRWPDSLFWHRRQAYALEVNGWTYTS